MMGKYFLDTNIFLRAIVKEDKKSFSECHTFLRLIEKKKIQAFTANIILAEIVWTLGSYYKFSRREILTTLRGIQSIKGLAMIDKHNLSVTLEMFEKSSVKYVDCLISSLPMILAQKSTVISYDNDFDKLGVKCQTPGKVIMGL